MSSPDCKRQKLADDVNSVAKMSKVPPTKNVGTQTENGTSAASTSKKVSAQKFEEVAELDGFVNRMLIEELLQRKKGEEDRYVMIFAPSKFGKTLNLRMIRLFCDIEDKNTKTKEDVAKDPTMEDLRSNPSKNMKIFLRQFEGTEYEANILPSNCLREQFFVIQHFGRHPVVLFDFKDCIAENKSRAIFFCAKQVKKGYLEHEYLINSKEFQSDDPEHVWLKQICTNWLNYSDVDLKNLFVEDVNTGLQNLIQSLRIHWGRKPVFLVDEVDKPCVAAMENGLSDEEEIEQLNLQTALVTGICKLINSGLSPMDNTLPVYFLSDKRFSKYYGLTAQEVETLVKRLCGSNAVFNFFLQRGYLAHNLEEPIENVAGRVKINVRIPNLEVFTEQCSSFTIKIFKKIFDHN